MKNMKKEVSQNQHKTPSSKKPSIKERLNRVLQILVSRLKKHSSEKMKSQKERPSSSSKKRCLRKDPEEVRLDNALETLDELGFPKDDETQAKPKG